MKFVARRVLLRVRIHNVETTSGPRNNRPDFCARTNYNERSVEQSIASGDEQTK